VTLLPLLLLLVVALAVAGGVAVVRRIPRSRQTAVVTARRHAAGTSAAALAAAALAGLFMAITGWDALPGLGQHGRGVLLAPVAAGIAHTAVLLLGELTWPRPQGEVRRARLVRRGPLDAGPRWLVRLTALTLGSLVVLLTVCLLTSDHTGRRVSVHWAFGSAASGPYPGYYYAVPVLVGLAALVGLTALALRAVADRPAVATEDERAEAALRRASAHRVLRGATAAGLVLLAGLLLAVGASLRSLPHVIGAPATAVLTALGPVAVVLGIGIGLLAVVVACIPARSGGWGARFPRSPASGTQPGM